MQKQKGIIGLFILIIIALILAKYFYDFSIIDAANSPQGHETISYTQTLFNAIWSVIGKPLTLIWINVVVPIWGLLWDNFVHFLTWGKAVGGN